MSARSRRPVVPDLNWRPLSYSDHPDPVAAILSQVKGQARRQILRRRLRDALPSDFEYLAKEELTPAEREAWGNLFPQHMGGEYLPPRGRSVEIARIVMRSTTMDVVSIRARRHHGRIGYSAVDEYPDMHDFIVRPRSSTRPLTLGQLADLVSGLLLAGEGSEDFITQILAMNADCGGPETLPGFLWVESEVYPWLGTVMDGRIDAIIARLTAVEEEEDAAG